MGTAGRIAAVSSRAQRGRPILTPAGLPLFCCVCSVEDLAVASPATVSRCGMVYFEPANLGWVALIDTWRPALDALLPERSEWIVGVMKGYFPAILSYVSQECKQMIVAVDSNLVRSCCTLLQSLVKSVKQASEADSENGGIADEDMAAVMNCQLFTAIVWSFGANLHDSSRSAFSNFIRAQLQVSLAPSLPMDSDVFDYFFDVSALRWVNWNSKVPAFKYDPNEPYFNILVATAETVKYTYFLDVLLQGERNVLCVGETGVGKSVIVLDYLKNASVERKALPGVAAPATLGIVPIQVMFSAQTSANNLQDVMETKLEKKRKNLFGAPVGKKVVLFVDDLNMPRSAERALACSVRTCASLRRELFSPLALRCVFVFFFQSRGVRRITSNRAAPSDHRWRRFLLARQVILHEGARRAVDRRLRSSRRRPQPRHTAPDSPLPPHLAAPAQRRLAQKDFHLHPRRLPQHHRESLGQHQHRRHRRLARGHFR